MDSLRQLNEAITLYLGDGCSLNDLEIALARIEASMPQGDDPAANDLLARRQGC
jgi:hypothetical protein